ncbi:MULTISPECIES: GNAT family N-acetyltransferase [Candidatus Cryosericum]|jgi:ribosomal protein S18 acetylase RimI-like enzyme|uniref:GNAT family N-acetyltransferase n=2 Tax=Candidatus Cryosericum TaxID=2498709 RepID=A0A398D4C9_9BACT|nr:MULTISPECIES: GNAT family N-acetyltransferase [Cryosericum]RIE09180.1 GNAT family N-acetyltransferase [Candidatus Cryosericum hinesii]RIE10062.1 GNAT family N-acetyltransferase [Candidatus Cryosericum odellii]RIE13008.1 GNAT family N-acetyltransferase [Candidatus Cryosericum hinesii]
MPTDDDGIMVPVWLSTQQVSQVRALAGVCEGRDGYSMEARLDFGTLETRPEGSVSDVLWYESGQLVGFAGMNSYGDPSEVEATILVHPDFRRKGIGRRMARVVVRECQEHEVRRLLIVVPQESREGPTFAAAMGTRHSHSEYTMDLDTRRIPPFEPIHDAVELRPAGAEDVPVMAAIVASAFAEPVQEEEQALVRLMKDPMRTTYLAAQDGRPVGVIQSAVSDGRVFIIHFAVRPEMQGQGIGRQMLMAIVRGLQNSGSQWITIEVETENRNALSLYQRCGFVTINATDYELLELPRIPTAPELLFDC